MTVEATNSKNKKVMTYSLNATAQTIVSEAESSRVSELVFPTSTGEYYHNLSKVWYRVRKAAKVNCRLHALRGTAACLMLNAGVPMELKELKGHPVIPLSSFYFSY